MRVQMVMSASAFKYERTSVTRSAKTSGNISEDRRRSAGIRFIMTAT